MRKNYGQVFIEFLLFSNFWVALCAGVLSAGFTHHSNYPSPVLAGILTFCLTYCAYNFHRLVKIWQLETIDPMYQRLYWQKKQLRFAYFFYASSLIAGAFLFIYLWGITLEHWIFLGSIVVISFFYIVPLPFTQTPLRSIPFGKIFWIALAWVLLFALPLVMTDISIPYTALVTCGLWVIAQSIPFDIRDVEYDRKSLRTIPQLLGTTGSRVLATVLILVPFFLDSSLLISPVYWLAILVSMLGCWLTITPKSLLYLEILWEGALLILGVHYWLNPMLI